MKKELIVSTILVGLLTGCVSDTLKSLNQHINSLGLDTTPKASIIVLGTNIDNATKLQGEASVYLLNTKTNKEKKILITNYTPSAVAFNIEAGKYKFSKWTYNACKIMSVNKYGKQIGCTQYYQFKGNSEPLENTIFTINKGETLYLGHLTLNSKNKTISIKNNEKEDLKNLESFFNLNNRVPQNKSILINNWKFQITGTKGFLQ